MPRGVLTLETGSRFWFEGEVWEVDAFLGDQVRLRRGATIRSVSTTALLETASPLDEREEGPDSDADPFSLPTVILAALTVKQRHEVERKVEELRPLLQPGQGDSRSLTKRVAAQAKELGVSVRTLERRMERFEARGPAGLVDERLLKETRRSVDPAWDEACRKALSSFVPESTPTRKTVIDRTNRAFLAEHPEGRLPSKSVAYLRVGELAKGRYIFGDAKQRRSVDERPAGPMGRLRANRPGEFFVLDSYRLDVFALEPVTHRWVNTELTVAMDIYDRTVKGLRLRPVAAKSADVASVLFQAMTPQRWGYLPDAPEGPYAGIPQSLYVGETCIAPDTIVIDHGNIYVSEHTASVCRRLGISIQPALTYKPTDKAVLERFFRTAREGLLDKLEGYKGPDIASRGKDTQDRAFYYVSELEQILREWVGQVYHHTPHEGLPKPESPREFMTPAQAHARGMAQCGRLRLPVKEELYYDFLQVHWRKVHHYGVEVASQRYDGAGLNLYRNQTSPYGGAHAGKWPILLDVDDVRYAYFQDPTDGTWHQLVWEHAATLTAPFSQDAADFTRALSRQKDRFVDPAQAIEDLLARWQANEVTTRRERNLAIRLAAQQAHQTNSDDGTQSGTEAGPDTASVPGVIDFLQHRNRRARQPLPDDLDVFERYYQDHPEGGLEVLDE